LVILLKVHTKQLAREFLDELQYDAGRADGGQSFDVILTVIN